MNGANLDPQENRVPVVALVGFLGAGKTTLLRHLLSCQEDMSGTVVILNDFGEIGIDSALIASQGSEVVELVSGCVCCTLVVDLTLTLRRMVDEHQPRRIVIEASGVADPSGLAAIFNHDDLKERVALHKIVTVLDAQCWQIRTAFGQLFLNQLESASHLVLNKIDLIGAEQLRLALAELHEALPETRVTPAVQCRIDADSLWDTADRDEFTDASIRSLHDAYVMSPEEGLSGLSGGEAKRSHVHADDVGYIAFAFEHEDPMDEGRFREFIDALPFVVFRVKGMVRFPDRTDVVNLVGGHGEWRAWNGPPATRLAFVGWGIESKTILEQLAACLVEGERA